MLTDVAYTLQTGREAMQKRIAFETNSISELIIKLNDYCSGKRNFESYDNVCINSWLSGEEINWESFYSDSDVKPKRVPLPSYPFEKKQYWCDSFFKKTITPPQIKLKTLKSKNNM
ncbi:MAG: hypothetical protein HQK79_00625 [Desulfobacterales bacterium]|nr:hypothetical protein [Desulfobacterales bacterium]MBF0395295.1 hypothetical protein [Desulfobacterales bacterium]